MQISFVWQTAVCLTANLCCVFILLYFAYFYKRKLASENVVKLLIITLHFYHWHIFIVSSCCSFFFLSIWVLNLSRSVEISLYFSIHQLRYQHSIIQSYIHACRLLFASLQAWLFRHFAIIIVIAPTNTTMQPPGCQIFEFWQLYYLVVF
jgi:hypothetical protein